MSTNDLAYGSVPLPDDLFVRVVAVTVKLGDLMECAPEDPVLTVLSSLITDVRGDVTMGELTLAVSAVESLDLSPYLESA